MTHKTALQALADATRGLTGQHDIHDILAQLMLDCRDLLPADGIGAMVRTRGGLDLLASSSHRTSELELFQIQVREGPCHECITTGSHVQATGQAQIRARWQQVGPAIAAAGFDTVHAFPIRWNTSILGGLNVFGRARPAPPDPVLGQIFADVIGTLLVRQLDLKPEEIINRVEHVLADRAIIQQAKGLLAYQHHTDMAHAYQLLADLSHQDGLTLTATATDLITRAQQH